MTEREMERLIFAYPARFLNETLQPDTLRSSFGSGLRTDLIFRDSEQRRVIVEVKKGSVGRGTAAQLLDYYGLLRQRGIADPEISA
jgi:RecB family endonuclease NucS